VRALIIVSLLAFANPVFAAGFHGSAAHFGNEQCFVLDRFSSDSNAHYKAKDAEAEAKLCSIDFASGNIGPCPKTWSTSPGTIVYDLGESKYQGRPDPFEAEYCPQQRALKGKVSGVKRLASFKQSVNGQFGQRTSATYSQASPLYYHFSRYLNATVDVPVAVMRTMNAQAHLNRVAMRGKALAHGGMIAAGWQVVVSAERNPAGYVPTGDFYYGDSKDGLLYGTMLKGPGTRYGPEFNGNIAGRGYSAQYLYIQKTPAFLALASSAGFVEAAQSGLTAARQDPVINRALGPGASNQQMMLWMTELADILLLDHIFSQQDRPGNIDYQWVWYYVDSGGNVKSVKVDSEAARPAINTIQAPAEVKQSSQSYLLQKTALNDNDAAGRRYTNFTKKFGLLAKLRHLHPITYRQLIRLADDFQAKGPLYSYLSNTFALPVQNVAMIVQNTLDAAQVLKANCKSGVLKFDLDFDAYLASQKVDEMKLDCDKP
jgi:hypothetical protein